MVRPKRYRNFLIQAADSLERPRKARTFDGYEKDGERYYYIRMEHSIEAMKKLIWCTNVRGVHPSELLEYTRLRDTPKDPEKNNPLDLSQHKYQCNTCERWFKWREGLRRHIATIHSSRVYHCPECIFHANRKEVVRVHMHRKHMKPFARSVENVIAQSLHYNIISAANIDV